MKTIIAMTVLSAIVLVSCTKKLDNMSTQQKEDLVSNSWRITYFWDNDHEETNDYNGYSFEFKEGGSLVANKGSSTFTGTWFIDDSSDNHPNGELVINISGNDELDEINDDGNILELDNDHIYLQDDSQGGTSIEELKFEKTN